MSFWLKIALFAAPSAIALAFYLVYIAQRNRKS